MKEQLWNGFGDLVLKVILLKLIFLSCSIQGGKTLRITRLEVPSSVSRGAPVLLVCNFNLEDAELYSVKWYKDYVEFYRFMPSNDPEEQKQVFPLKGVHVKVSESNGTHVSLWKTEITTEGTYACEVSTTESFTTIRAQRQMKVYVLPQKGLHINGKEYQYDIGHTVNLTCVSSPSWPPLNLTWYINDQKANANLLVSLSPKTKSDELSASSLQLIFQTRREHFVKGLLKIKCTAALILVYEFETTQLLVNGVSRNVSKENADALNRNLLLRQEKEVPVISGVLRNYRVGDRLNFNCSCYSPQAVLEWRINDEPANRSHLKFYSDENFSGQMLGLQMEMQQEHFQVPEVKLSCKSVFRRTIADFHEEVKFETESLETIGAHSSVDRSVASIGADVANRKSGLTSLFILPSIFSIIWVLKSLLNPDKFILS